MEQIPMRYLGQVLEIHDAVCVAHLISEENPDEFMIVEFPVDQADKVVLGGRFYIDTETDWQPHFLEPSPLSSEEIAQREAEIRSALGLD